MSEQDPKISELEARLDRLVRTQIDFQKEISLIRGELMRLRGKGEAESKEKSLYVAPIAPKPSETTPPPPPPPRPAPPRPETSSAGSSTQSQSAPNFGYQQAPRSEERGPNFASKYADNARADLEKFIGENLLSKIGIVVLVLGVGIGAKYAIDNNLISPATRIIIGYIFGFGLVGLAIKLKPKYLNFSAVLMSGGMAIMYFVTYFAYSAYGLMPQLTAFALMVMFTIFTVLAALLYSRQVIAHVGLVGAYAVPFLLSTDSGNYLALFGYMAVVNLGILAISVKKNWVPIFYTSSAFTWVIFAAWFATKYSAADHLYLALIFLAVFFAIFYATKLVHRVTFGDGDENVFGAAMTALVFYGLAFFINARSDGAADTWAVFTYIAVASAIILATSFKPYRRTLMYVVVPLIWLTYGYWFAFQHNSEQEFVLASTFAGVFFAIVYLATLAHRLIDDNLDFIESTGLFLANAFIFYGFGYAIIDGQPSMNHLLGLYTAANSALHLIVAMIVGRVKSEASDIVQVLTILVLTFASIAIPVQFDGNFVTLIWSVEAALLFWFGRTRAIKLFEYFSYPVMALATMSMALDWVASYNDRLYASVDAAPMRPIANGDFVTAIVFVTAFTLIYLTNRDEDSEPAIPSDLVRPFGYAVAGIGTFVLYNLFRLEIANYFHIQTLSLVPPENPAIDGLRSDVTKFDLLWQINYTLFFLIAMGVANLQKLRSMRLSVVNCALGVFALAIFALAGMLAMHELRLSYMALTLDPIFTSRSMYVALRPISYLFAVGLLFILYRYSRDKMLTSEAPRETLVIGYDGLVYSFAFVVTSFELINLMAQFGIPDATKLGLSILWGVYALMLVVIGIARDKKYLRVAAIALFAVTLAKLFLYDIADLGTIPKTILFVTLGILLLVVSFLYNKYKNVIFSQPERPE